MSRSPTHAAALDYARRGWWVFPCVVGGKTPLPGTRGHLDATIDPATIDAIWGRNPQYNVGIAVAPSGLYVLDVDVGKKQDGTPKHGRESLAKIEHELTPTLLAETGRGGLHAVYTRPEGLAPHRYIDIGKTIPHVGKDSGLDLIGEGYIVAAPSFSSESGRFYQWIQQQALASLPPFLINAANAPQHREVVGATGTAIVEGNRNNALFKLGAALRDTGIGREALARALDAENRERFNPPLPDPEVAQIVDSVMNTVEVKRDVAAGTIVQQQIDDIFAPPPPQQEMWLEDVSHVPMPPVAFYSTGLVELDRLTGGGFRTRQFTGLIGTPSSGKSALIGHWLLLLARHRPVLHCSLELDKHELFVRYAAHEMKLPWSNGVRGEIPQAAMAHAVKGIRIKLMGADEFDRVDPFDSLEAAAARMRQELGVSPIIAIDYIQLLARGAGTEMRHKVGELSFRARKLSQRLDTVTIGVFTTQRSSYNTAFVEKMRAAADPTAYLGAAKESGDIEFDCATLMYLDVDKLHEGPCKPAQIAVARCRQGDVGFVGLRAQLDIGGFTEDATAVTEFASEARHAKREEGTMEQAREAVLHAIRTMPNRPWRELQRQASAGGTNRAKADQARDQLLTARVIAETERYDENHRKMQGKAYILVSGTNGPAPALLQEDDGHDDA